MKILLNFLSHLQIIRSPLTLRSNGQQTQISSPRSGAGMDMLVRVFARRRSAFSEFAQPKARDSSNSVPPQNQGISQQPISHPPICTMETVEQSSARENVSAIIHGTMISVFTYKIFFRTRYLATKLPSQRRLRENSHVFQSLGELRTL